MVTQNQNSVTVLSITPIPVIERQWASRESRTVLVERLQTLEIPYREDHLREDAFEAARSAGWRIVSEKPIEHGCVQVVHDPISAAAQSIW